MYENEEQLWKLESRAVMAGAAGGLLAGIAMGLILQVGTDLLPVFGAFAGDVSVVNGWLVHLVMSALYGVFFAVVLAYPPIRSFMKSFRTLDYTLVGVTYAVMMAAVTVTILPFVFELPWITAASQAPYPSIPSAVLGGLVPAASFGLAHLVFGAILGVVYAEIGVRED